MEYNPGADLGRVVGAEILKVSSVGGGDTGRSYRVTTTGGDLFVKRYSTPGLSGMEARGIAAMAAGGGVAVPEVMTIDERFLVLKFIEQAPACRDFQTRLGRGLARMHKAATADYFGFPEDNYIGRTPQVNSRNDKWAGFFIENRIDYQIGLSTDSGLAECWDRLRPRVPGLLSGTEEPPCLIHGDLWGGNVISGPDGLPVLIDPAAYYGHREMDLGMTRLFGGFSQEFYAAYDSEYPLKPGWKDRTALYSLYHVLNHYNMFGGGYRSQAVGIMKRYL